MLKFKLVFINHSTILVQGMWTLVIISHFLMLISFILLIMSAFKGHFVPSIGGGLTLSSYSIVSIMIYVFTQSLIFFLIITINKSINTIILENDYNIKNDRYKYYKRKMHMHTSSNILIISTLAILFGAFGSHALKERLSGQSLEVYDIATRYLMFHALGIFLIALLFHLSILSTNELFSVSF